jgi:SAM-dependent methyltransferase
MSTPRPWDLVADAYSEELVPIFELYARDALRLAAPPPGSRIVDVACGPGALAVIAAQQGYVVDALDFAPSMIERLHARAGERSNLTACVGDGQALPYADGTMAAGFSMFGLMFFPDRAKGFAELRRVLAPGARAVVGSWAPLESVTVLAAMFAGLRAAVVAVLGDRAPTPGAAPNPLSTEEACREEMSAAFVEVEVHRIVHTQQHASVDAFWDGAQRTTAPLVLMRANLGDEPWRAISDRVRASLRETLGTGPVEVMMPAFLSVGTAR